MKYNHLDVLRAKLRNFSEINQFREKLNLLLNEANATISCNSRTRSQCRDRIAINNFYVQVKKKVELLYLRSYWYSINRGEKARLISDDQRQEIRGRNALGVKNKRTTSRRVPFLIERLKKREHPMPVTKQYPSCKTRNVAPRPP